MGKILKMDSEARSALKVGIDLLADMVAVTMGAQGRPIVISKLGQPVIMTKDGVTVADEVEADDPVTQAGILLIKGVANKTADEAGDGTTTATILTQSIIDAGMELVKKGGSAVEIKRGIDLAVNGVIKYLEETSEPITGNFDKIKEVATVSANNDSSIGDLIADAIKIIGEDGYISVEPSRIMETTTEVVEGTEFDRGYESPYFITDNKRQEAIQTDPLILICDFPLHEAKAIIPMMQLAQQQQRPLVIMADEFDATVINILVEVSIRQELKCIAVKSPEFAEKRTDMIGDIAAMTGGKVFTKVQELPEELTDCEFDDLGQCQRVKSSRDNTTFVDGKGTEEEVTARVEMIDAQLKQTQDAGEIQFLQLRRAKLISGVAVIHLGASSDVEMKEKLDRVIDAIHATRAAINEGIVVGGGLALLRASETLSELTGENNDQQMGIDIIQAALRAPAKQIIANAISEAAPTSLLSQVDKAEEILEDILDDTNPNYGFNVKTEEFTDMLEAGIIDPAKVTRVALINAASVAGMFLLTGGIIIEDLDI